MKRREGSDPEIDRLTSLDYIFHLNLPNYLFAENPGVESGFSCLILFKIDIQNLITIYLVRSLYKPPRIMWPWLYRGLSVLIRGLK